MTLSFDKDEVMKMSKQKLYEQIKKTVSMRNEYNTGLFWESMAEETEFVVNRYIELGGTFQEIAHIVNNWNYRYEGGN